MYFILCTSLFNELLYRYLRSNVLTFIYLSPLNLLYVKYVYIYQILFVHSALRVQHFKLGFGHAL